MIQIQKRVYDALNGIQLFTDVTNPGDTTCYSSGNILWDAMSISGYSGQNIGYSDYYVVSSLCIGVLTPSIVNSNNFGISLQFYANSCAIDTSEFRIFNVEMNVSYSYANSSSTYNYLSSSYSNNTTGTEISKDVGSVSTASTESISSLAQILLKSQQGIQPNAIIGIAVGSAVGIVIIGVVLLIVLFLWYRRSGSKDNHVDINVKESTNNMMSPIVPGQTNQNRPQVMEIPTLDMTNHPELNVIYVNQIR